MRLAVVQVRDIAADVAARGAHCVRTLQTCADAGADLVLFPELYLGGYVLDRDLALKAGQAQSTLGRIQAAVDELGLNAVLGLPLARGSALFNATAVLSPGAPAALCAKTHLFRAEKEWFTAGAEFWTGQVAGWPAGVLVCYEIGFPEIARVLALRGARLLLVPAAFAARREHIWRAATAARALENGCYLAAADHAGPGQAGDFLGASCIVDPRGALVAGAGTADEVLVADLDASLVDEVREGDGGGHTYFADRRPELYREISRASE